VVHRQRPFVDGPFVDWSGYSFASGHTIAATLLYGQLLLFVLPALKTRHWRLLCIFSAISLVLLVGFSRIALGAHFLTDVVGAMIFGAIWLALCVLVGKSMRSRSRSLVPELVLPIGADPAVLPVGKPESASAVEISR
jgi:undecaprenyl-diphosphatase